MAHQYVMGLVLSLQYGAGGCAGPEDIAEQPDNLLPEQVNVRCERVGEMARYLLKLRKRMHEVGFPADDPLYELVGEARHAVHLVWLELHSR